MTDTTTNTGAKRSRDASTSSDDDFTIAPPKEKRVRIEPPPAHDVKTEAGSDCVYDCDDYGYPPAGPQQFDWLGYQRAMQQMIPTAHGTKHFWHPEDPYSHHHYATAFDVGLALHQLGLEETLSGPIMSDVLASIERHLHSPQYESTSTWRIAPIDDKHLQALLTAAADDKQVNEHKTQTTTTRWLWLRVIGTMRRPSRSRGLGSKPLPTYAQLVAEQQPFRRAEVAEMLVQFALVRLLKRPLDDVLYRHHRDRAGCEGNVNVNVNAFWQPFSNADMDKARSCLQVSGPIGQQSSSSSSSSATSSLASNLEAYIVHFDSAVVSSSSSSSS